MTKLDLVMGKDYSFKNKSSLNYVDRLEKISMNRWFDIGDDTAVMRVPGYLFYRVKGHQITKVEFNGGDRGGE